MSELRTRLRTVDRLPAPDLWSEATERAIAAPSTTSRPAWPSGHTWRLGLFVALLVLASIGVAVVGSLIRTPELPSQRLPGNGWVAYPQPYGGNTGSPSLIYLVREGEEPRIFNGPQRNPDQRQTCPAFSPDGTRLAYAERTGYRDGKGWSRSFIVIVAMDPSGMPVGSQVRIQLAADEEPCPHWSPDSERIAWTGGGSLWTAHADGSAPVDLGALSPDYVGWPPTFAWSPDGEAIAGVRGTNGSELWLIPVDGGAPALIYSARGSEIRGVSWSPDGTRLAIGEDSSIRPTPLPDGESYPNAEQEWAVWVIRADGAGEPVRVGDGDGPVWSPRGDRLAYVAEVSTSTIRQVGQIVVVSPDGRNEIRLPSVSDGERVWSPSEGPVWSPDGRRLLYIGSTGLGGWGDSTLVSVAANGEHEPVLLGGRWFQEYYWGLSWQATKPSDGD
jgi:Tol biopolymer transport system component